MYITHVPLFSVFLLTLSTDIETLANNGDTAGIERVKALVYRPESPAPSRASAGSPANFPAVVNGYGSPPVVPMPPSPYPASAAPAAAPYTPHGSSCALTRQELQINLIFADLDLRRCQSDTLQRESFLYYPKVTEWD